MHDFFRAELARFRLPALLVALVHLLVLGFLSRLTDLAQASLISYRLIAIAYAALGVLLGAYQMGTYRRPSTWLALLHRPLPPWRIAGGLFGAGGVVLLVAVSLPVLGLLGWQSTMTARLVESRHAWFPLAAWLIAACGYFVGAYGMLANRRHAASGLVFLLLLLTARADGAANIVVQLLALGWLAAMVAVSFRPDRLDGPRGPVSTVLLALPLQMATYVVAWMALSLGMQMAWMAAGTSPTNGGAADGGVVKAQQATPRSLMSAGLQASTLPQAKAWRDGLTEDGVIALGMPYADNPVRAQLSNIVPLQWADTHTDTLWTFSHDHMRMVGRGLADDHGARGELGVGRSQAPFPTIAVPHDPPAGIASKYTIFIAGDTVYRHVADENAAEPWLRLPNGETVQGAPSVEGSRVLLQGSRALYVFDRADALVRAAWPQAPMARIPVPGSVADLGRVDVTTVDDGLLVSFAFTGGGLFYPVSRHQDLVLVDGEGAVTNIATRTLAYDFPAWYRYADWWLSPAMDWFDRVAKHLFEPTPPLGMSDVLPPPAGSVALAILLCVLAAVLAGWRVQRLDIGSRTRAAWIIACAAIGLPALASLWLLYPAAEREKAAAALRPSIA
ncbi:hypothetical protein [Pinirhizobacter soli]|uniref:hypothetical protein n=1 Tax=Pinirhizobacter soli TaxID=2786953 RepID=UPI00202A85F8|nr:hypothetical protein [Pinirhizobacter soli]